MDIPKGLRKLHRIAELVPVILGLVAFAVVAFGAYLDALRSNAGTGATGRLVAGAGFRPTLFQPEVLYGVGTVVLALGLAWGLWRTRRRNRSQDRASQQATREAYDHPDRGRPMA